MISLRNVDNNNYQALLKLKLKPHQIGFVADVMEILARGYVYRSYNAQVFAIYCLNQPIGLCLKCDLEDIYPCYEIQEFFIGDVYQNKGYGKLALKQLINIMNKEHKYDNVETCVKIDNALALALYKDFGFEEVSCQIHNNSLTLRYVLK